MHLKMAIVYFFLLWEFGICKENNEKRNASGFDNFINRENVSLNSTWDYGSHIFDFYQSTKEYENINPSTRLNSSKDVNVTNSCSCEKYLNYNYYEIDDLHKMRIKFKCKNLIKYDKEYNQFKVLLKYFLKSYSFNHKITLVLISHISYFSSDIDKACIKIKDYKPSTDILLHEKLQMMCDLHYYYKSNTRFVYPIETILFIFNFVNSLITVVDTK